MSEEVEGPHCLGGTLVEVRRWELSSGFRRLVFVDVSFVPASFPSTLVARPWMADHEFPHIPDSVFVASLPNLAGCDVAERSKDDVGPAAALERDGRGERPGEAAGDPAGEAYLLFEGGLSSSSTEIKRRVRGRRVEV